MLRQALPLGLLALLIAGCQTQPKQTVLNLDTTDPAWTSFECVKARRTVHDYNDKGGLRGAVGVAGTVAAGPIAGAAASTALSVTQDDEREDLNNAVKRACVSKPGERSAVAAVPPPVIPAANAGAAGQPASVTAPAKPQ
jgi:hypothetical protein